MRLYRIGHVNVHAVTRQETRDTLYTWMTSPYVQGKYVVTPYSEFIVEAHTNKTFKNVLNRANLSLPDGSGIIWSGHFLYRTSKTLYVCLRTLVQLVFRPASGIYDPFPEKLSGSDLVFDIFSVCNANSLRVFFVGGVEETRRGVQAYIEKYYPNIQYGGHYTGKVDETHTHEIRTQIHEAQPHILITALSPPYQELWLAHHIGLFPSVRVGFPLGGTLDYVAGTKSRAPNRWRRHGLEWVWRLIHEPRRLPRMYRATSVFIRCIMREGRREVRNRKQE